LHPGPQVAFLSYLDVTTANLPTISVVTATLNRANYLEEAMRSVLEQDYPRVEYVVVDGASTDGSVELIRRYEHRLTWWCSERDEGHFDALNKGFTRTTGEVMAWLNSDDKYTPWAFQVAGEIFAALPQVQWLTTLFPILWDARGRAMHCKRVEGFSRAGFLRGEHFPRPGSLSSGWIQQESTFWRRSLWEKAGGRVDASLRVAGDFELWARFFEHADLYGVTTPIGGFRIHGEQFTQKQIDRINEVCEGTLRRHGGRPYGPLTTRLFRSRLGRYIPGKVKRLIGVQHRKPIVTYDGARGAWVTKMVD
jgi:glycosyltransferase involved in cell wall biosynthesis